MRSKRQNRLLVAGLCACAAGLTLQREGLGVAAMLAVMVVWLAYRLGCAERGPAATPPPTGDDIRLAERARIARALHDAFLQSLQSLILRLGVAIARLPAGSNDRLELERALDLSTAVMEEGRDELMYLRAATVSTDLATALARSAERFRHDSAVAVAIHSRGAALAMSALTRSEVVRIACEAIANALRHAQARHVDIALEWGSHALTLAITDDGVGLPDALLLQTRLGGWGLTGMHERALLIGANLSLARRAEGGSRVTLVVPCTPQPEDAGLAWHQRLCGRRHQW
ncbi:signal transduction histidine kinase [Duganella sp. 3397]|uniref:sensor histidine kinase n=1 Tax=Duganella sp. 3397 TaxID=2817732 RepID=UPI00285AAF5D|nr:ATP-binding protein [Duganella sp. 3397]MDR7050597.1 signal transduction histidine kinase [Duganella sp. 3397]